MHIIYIAFLFLLPHAHPINAPRDGSSDDLFSAFNFNTATDSTFGDLDSGVVSSPLSTLYSLTAPDTTDTTDTSIVDISEDENSALSVDDSLGLDASIRSPDPLIADTNFEPGDASSTSKSGLLFAGSGCDDSSAVEAGSLFAQDEPSEDSSNDLFERSTSAASPEDDIPIAESKDVRKKAKIRRSFPALNYPLDPNIGPWVPVENAVTDGGFPLRNGYCPDGKKRSCCIWNDIPPFSRCWLWKLHGMVCPYAKNQACCTGVEPAGGPGIDCQAMRWVKDTRPRQNPSSPPPNANKIDNLQEIFPILQKLPDLNPYCKPQRRL